MEPVVIWSSWEPGVQHLREGATPLLQEKSETVGGIVRQFQGEGAVFLVRPVVTLRGPLFSGRPVGREPQGGLTLWFEEEDLCWPPPVHGMYPTPTCWITRSAPVMWSPKVKG